MMDLGAEIPESRLGDPGCVRGAHVQAVGNNTSNQPRARAIHKGGWNCGAELQELWGWHPRPCGLLQGCDEEYHLHSRHLVGPLEDHALEGVCGRGHRERGRDPLENALVEHRRDQGNHCVELRSQNVLRVRNAKLLERHRSSARECRRDQSWLQTEAGEKVNLSFRAVPQSILAAQNQNVFTFFRNGRAVALTKIAAPDCIGRLPKGARCTRNKIGDCLNVFEDTSMPNRPERSPRMRSETMSGHNTCENDNNVVVNNSGI